VRAETVFFRKEKTLLEKGIALTITKVRGETAKALPESKIAVVIA
jgi:hypothetical protein